MQVNTSNAAKIFFPNPSLEMVYFEAVANSIDANATSIDIIIKINSYSDMASFTIEIKDNGDGFTDKNFEQFSKLLQSESEDHKGLGRLVYLHYFKSVDISSVYGDKKRTFTFDDNWKDKNKVNAADIEENLTVLKFKGYRLEKIKSYDYLKPESIRQKLLLHFFPLFYRLKIERKELCIKILLQTKEANQAYDFYTDSKEILVSKIPKLKSLIIDSKAFDLFEKIELFYSIRDTNEPPSAVTAICVDDRTIPMEILSKSNIPFGFEVIFILYSKLFVGKADPARQKLTFDDANFKIIKKIFGLKVGEILNKEIPNIQKQNARTTEILEDTYPHLKGYFDERPVGLMEKNEVLSDAQEKFFSDQREILEAQSLSDEQYQKSLSISSRILMEYILYRNLIINKLKQIDKENSEDDIHNIIVPMRKKYTKKDYMNDLYTNNAWLLDDKYMSYTAIFSDKKMESIIKEISFDEEITEGEDKRPDIAIVFSNDPEVTPRVDVVIVELKKLELSLERKNDIVVQLVRRATKLLHLYPNKIQRIWFYGVIDIDIEFKLLLKGMGFTELFSNDSVLYKPQDIYLNEELKIPIGIYIQSFNAFIDDAESRNSTFLSLLKEGIKRQ